MLGKDLARQRSCKITAWSWIAALAFATLLTSRAGAIGLVYVDAINDDDLLTGTFGPNANIAPQASFSTGITPDNLWGYRSGFGAESPTFSRYVWESGGTATGSAVEDSPEGSQSLSGLTPSTSYDVYVVYWSSNGANWGLRTGLTSGNYQLFDRTAAAGAVAGTVAGSAIWNAPPTSGSVPIFTEADRTMYLGKVGTAAANGQGRISVFFNDRPNTTDQDRSWLDGLAYIPAGTAITLNASVNRATGNLTVTNSTGEILRFTSYTVTSAASALKPASWLSIQDNYVGSGPGKLDTDPWTVTAPSQPYPAFTGTLSETESGFDGAALTNGGASFNLGAVWARSPFEDLQVQFTLVGGGTLTVTPQYTGAAIASGDFNADGNLNLTDYLNLRDHMHTDLTPLALTRVENYAMGDVNGDSLVNFQDFTAFRNSYIQVNGSGSFEAMLTSVPEPSAFLLGTMCAMAARLGARRTGKTTNVTNHATNTGDANTGEKTTMSGDRQVQRLRVPSFLSLAVAAAAALLAAGQAKAQLVTGWGLDTTLANATLTEGVPGSFSVTTPSGNAGPRALLASPISLANVGDIIKLSGNATIQNSLGNQQFRFGLYNTNSHATGTLAGGVWTGADVTGWLGYMFQVGGAGGTDAVRGRTGTGAGVWLSNTDTYIVGSTATAVTAPANTPYAWSLTLARTSATAVRADYSFVGGTISRIGSYTDEAAGASASLASFNAVGFLLNANTGSAQISNVTVEVPKILRLRVNTTTGFVGIANRDATTTIAANYYEITSAAGALAPPTWMSLDGNATASTTSWEKAGGSSANILSETNLLGSLPFAPQGPNAALGKAFTPASTQDLVFRYGLPDGSIQTGFVEYVAGGPAGDFDVDGDVDGRDFLAWQRGLGTAFTAADLTAWRNTFGQTSATVAGQGVPEPGSLVMIALGVIAGMSRRTR
jgi:hypothetical protein